MRGRGRRQTEETRFNVLAVFTPLCLLLVLGGFRRWLGRRRLLPGILLLQSSLDHMVVAALLHEQLREVVLAVEDAVERGVGRRREHAAADGALEAGLVVRLSFHGHLPPQAASAKRASSSLSPVVTYRVIWEGRADRFQGVCCFLAGGTLVLSSTEHGGDLGWCLGLVRSRSYQITICLEFESCMIELPHLFIPLSRLCT